ncbi:hypothetical protein [Streptomyces sp. NPDC057675]|uniref:hypothetical protein n=1 Tax=Streptomyces sp. NPDC057675 TaxID=3346204 RepID=UPI0036BBB399
MPDFPFLYLNHGPLDPDGFDKVDGAVIGFRDEVCRTDAERIAASCPAPIAGFFHTDGRLFTCESPGDVFSHAVIYSYGRGDQDRGTVTAEAAAAFSRDVESWITRVHAHTPIQFFLGPASAYPGDYWDEWSRHCLPVLVVPWLERYLNQPPLQELPSTASPVELVKAERITTDDLACIAYVLDQHVEESRDLPADAADRITALSSKLQGMLD